jgi:hypothetical protein
MSRGLVGNSQPAGVRNWFFLAPGGWPCERIIRLRVA